MKRSALVSAAIIALACVGASSAASRQPVQVFVAGDSTAAEYGPERYPQLGWAMVLPCAFGPDVTVRDLAQSGRSTKSFISQGFFGQIEREIRAGDVLLVQFGHNDEKTDDPARGTNADGDFRTYLMRYVDMARAKGAQPILITPVARRHFKDGVLLDTHGAYARAVRDVAAQSHTPLIDLAADSMHWLSSLGDEASRRYFLNYTPEDRSARFPDGYEDNTHFSEMGARKVAELVATRLAALKLPISRRVLHTRPGLTRTTPLGGPSCEKPSTSQPAAVLAFPGAEGAGRFALGGRGGAVIKVTSLNDSGPGSLRAAVTTRGPGASLVRDSVDERVIRSVRERTGKLIDSQTEVGGWPMLASLPAKLDSDSDGMPDEWERAHRFKPDSADGRNDDDGNGYTNLEEYLSSLVEPRAVRVAPGDGHGEPILISETGKTYATLQSAVDALPERGGEITLAPGVYREKVTIARSGVRLQGVGSAPDEVVLAWSDGAINVGGTFKSATLNVTGDDFRADNLTIQNDYSLRGNPPSQAVALSVTGDRAVFSRVRALGAQDTLYAASKKCANASSPCPTSRQYFRDCYIEGHVDFIFGDSKAFFDRCEIHAIAHQEILLTAHSRTAADQDSAYVFDHCRITAEPEARNIYFGRPWRDFAAVVFMNTNIDADLNPLGWREWHPGETQRLATAYYAEYRSSGKGAETAGREPHAHRLSDDEAARWAMPIFLAGADGWRPSAEPPQ